MVSIVARMVKLPQSLTRLAADGLSPMRTTFWPIAANTGSASSRSAAARGGDEQSAGGRGVRPPEHRRGDIARPALVMQRRDVVSGGDGDRAERDVERALGQARQHAVIAGKRRVQGGIIRQHAEDDALAGARFLGRLGELGARRDQGLRLGLSSVPNRYGVAGFVDEIGGDGGTHGAETDEADIHVRYSL